MLAHTDTREGAKRMNWYVVLLPSGDFEVRYYAAN